MELEEPPLKDLLHYRHGNFTFTRTLGAGAVGVVFLAEHVTITRRKAVKVLLPEAARKPKLVARFMDEAIAATSCQHDHIVVIEDCGKFVVNDREHHYIDMEFLEGRDVGDECRLHTGTSRIEDVDRAVKIIGQAADALAAAHAHGVVHRDVKPENLFLTTRAGKADFVKVLDFGVARLMGEMTPGPRTRTGEILGTPLYMSPEQAAGLHVDGKTDVWSLGVVLYRMLAGVPPFVDLTFAPLAAKIQQEQARPLDLLRPDVPASVLRAVEAALVKDPAQRPSMQAWRDMLLMADAAPRPVAPERSMRPRSMKTSVEPPRPAAPPAAIVPPPPPAPPMPLVPPGVTPPPITISTSAPFSLTGPIPGPSVGPPRPPPRPARTVMLDDEETQPGHSHALLDPDASFGVYEVTQPGAPQPFSETQYTSAYGARRSLAAIGPALLSTSPGSTPRRAPTPRLVPIEPTDEVETPAPPSPFEAPAAPRPRRRTQ